MKKKNYDALSLLLLVSTASSMATSEPFTWNEEHARRYAETPKDASVVLGESVTLPCRTARIEDKVQWTKQGFGMGFERDFSLWSHRRYKMTGDDQCKSISDKAITN